MYVHVPRQSNCIVMTTINKHSILPFSVSGTDIYTFLLANSEGLLLVALRAVRAVSWVENSTNANPFDRPIPLASTLSFDLNILSCGERGEKDR